jgi:probable rRNA maturation factor
VIEIVVEEEAWLDRAPDCAAWAERAAAAALADPRSTTSFGPLPQGAGVTIVLDADAEVAELNHRFLGKSGPTNVLSFPSPRTAWPHLGDIVLALGVCDREAAEQGKSLPRHLAHLTVHGTLHLLGWDHMTEGDAEAMEALERLILAGLGVPDPYREGQGHVG